MFIGGAACLTEPAAVGAATSPDACALLSQAEVAVALGVAVDPGRRLMPNDARFCTWREHGKNQMQASNLQINLITERQYEIGKTPIASMTKTPQSGVGDEAYFSKAKGMVFNLSVKTGGTYFRVMARSNPDTPVKADGAASDQKDKAIDLAVARAIIKKL